MGLFVSLAKRLDQLERARMEVPRRKLRYGGLWLGVPAAFSLGGLWIKNGRNVLDKAGPVALWAGFILGASVLVFACSIYQNRVPIKIQFVVDLIVWSVMAWMFFHFKFWG